MPCTGCVVGAYYQPGLAAPVLGALHHPSLARTGARRRLRTDAPQQHSLVPGLDDKIGAHDDTHMRCIIDAVVHALPTAANVVTHEVPAAAPAADARLL